MQICFARMQITSAPKLPRWEQSSSSWLFLTRCRFYVYMLDFSTWFTRQSIYWCFPAKAKALFLLISTCLVCFWSALGSCGIFHLSVQSNTIFETNSNLDHNTLRATQHHKHCHLPRFIYGLKIYFIPKAHAVQYTFCLSHTRNNIPHLTLTNSSCISM